ncbi:hypothetical protein F2Q70_00039465 [Brassica cretica]|uniref:Uncharacterized protein n=1 Tax=Brassica cretica TaxID=69181 RepID=A0A8S9KDA0_BRACR|nr:hypothetical protein F2Q70_00039465 [Brassica cretica]
MRLLLFKARDLITGRRPSRHKRNLAPRSVSRLEDHRVCAWEPTCNNFIWGQRIVHQPLVGHHALMTSCGLTRHDERTPSVSVRSRQSWFDLANILHADCISHGNIHVHRDDSIVTVRPWWYVHDDVYGDLFLAVSRLTLHPWQLALVVPNTVFTDRLRNHPGVRSPIGIRSMSVTARPRWSVYDTSFMAT